MEISYWKNAKELGVAFKGLQLGRKIKEEEENSDERAGGEKASSLENAAAAFFAHVSTKNCKYHVNFGQEVRQRYCYRLEIEIRFKGS